MPPPVSVTPPGSARRARDGRAERGGAGQDAGVTYGGAGGNGNGYTGNGHGGNGRDGSGYPDYDGRRPGGSTALKEPDVRRRPGRHGGGGDGGGGGGREHRKGDWWRHWTLKKAVSIGAIAAGVMVILGAAGVGIAYSKTPVPTDPQLSAIQSASTVYFSNNKTRVGQFGTVDRQKLLYSQIPLVLRNAVVAAEDKNFWHEGGISPTGILRAAYYDLTSSGGNLQGGSTITQQLVRNYYANIGTAQTMTRKVKEIFVAQKLAQTTSKEQILKEYLNTVYFGHQAYGVGAAALYYFGLPASQINQITPAQAAMIAAMIQSPSYYTPDPKAGVPYQALVARWHYVINAMVGMGTLSPQEAAKAKFPTVVKPFNNNWGGYRGYIMQAVFNELEQTYGYTKDQINTAGLHVVTTFSKPLMDSLYATVNQNRALMKAGTPPALASGSTVGCGLKGCLPKYVHIGRGAREPGERRDPRHVQRAELQQDPVRQRAPVPQPGRLLVQAVRARDRGEAGHERPDEPARRDLAAVDPTGWPARDVRQPAAAGRQRERERQQLLQGAERRGGQPQPGGQRGRGDRDVAQHRLRRPLAPRGPDQRPAQRRQHGQGVRGGHPGERPAARCATRRAPRLARPRSPWRSRRT